LSERWKDKENSHAWVILIIATIREISGRNAATAEELRSLAQGGENGTSTCWKSTLPAMPRLNSAFRQALDGGERMDVVTNTAGIGAPRVTDAYRIEQFQPVVNLCAQEVFVGQVMRRLIYVTLGHQFPLGTTMSLARRFELLKWAESRAR
jgi:hypothetical protein